MGGNFAACQISLQTMSKHTYNTEIIFIFDIIHRCAPIKKHLYHPDKKRRLINFLELTKRLDSKTYISGGGIRI